MFDDSRCFVFYFAANKVYRQVLIAIFHPFRKFIGKMIDLTLPLTLIADIVVRIAPQKIIDDYWASYPLKKFKKALKKDDSNTVLKMIQEKKVDPLRLDGVGHTWLHIAALENSPEVLRLLLSNHPKTKRVDYINAENNQGNTPLHYAATRGHLQVIKVLVEERNPYRANVNAQNNDGGSPLHSAAYNGHKDAVAQLISSGADSNVEDNKGNTPLHSAACYGHKDAIAQLISSGADSNAENNEGSTSLHYAAFYGNKDAVAQLISSGADSNVEDNKGNTPLHYAVYQDHQEVARLLVYGKADVNSKSLKGWTPLKYAAYKGESDIVDLFVTGRRYQSSAYNPEFSPLNIAVLKGHLEVVKILVANIEDTEGAKKDLNSAWVLAKSLEEIDISDYLGCRADNGHYRNHCLELI